MIRAMVLTRAGALSGVALLLVCLSGCGVLSLNMEATPFIGARTVNGILEFRDCDPIPANQLKIRQGVEGGAPKDMEWVWVVESLNPSDPTILKDVVYGVTPEMMTVTTGPGKIQADSVVELNLLDWDGSELTNSRRATFHLNSVSEDQWLMADGKRVTDPCE